MYAAEQVEWLAPALDAALLVLSRELPYPAAIDRHGTRALGNDWTTATAAQAALPAVARTRHRGALPSQTVARLVRYP
ncbi:MAG: hypothetical protein NZ550_02225 [Fimbriimonadales bacterium]|nr:hypothetical protein [Fimbriimonadales bacterium]